MFDDVLRTFDLRRQNGPVRPHIELSETERDLKVVAELPGLEERDVSVTIEKGVLSLKGRISLRSGSLYGERWEGAFERVIPTGAGPRSHQAASVLGARAEVLLQGRRCAS
jgi:HSP20 family protein